MSMKYLGETIDIHGGGKDLIFPHHENEIAQSESLTGKKFANYWLHNGLIKVNGQKMSKSLNNGILLEDLLKEYNPEVVRLSLLENNYRSDMNVIDGMFDQNESKIYSVYKLFNQIDKLTTDLNPEENNTDYEEMNKTFINAMSNDFNTSLAISTIFEYVNILNKLLNKKEYQRVLNIKTALIKIYKTLGLLQQESITVIEQIKNKYIEIYNIDEEKVNKLISERQNYKTEKNWQEADRVRNELLNMGVVIKDNGDITEWDIDIPRK